ncbi:MAG: CZB domain-containing protein [Nitrospirae bacterium]|nr:CZB domain-containing protein [Nitrospirota bacterium]
MIDITLARITHIEWAYQLELALQKRNLTINIRNYNECELGVWLYTNALRLYGDIQEINSLEQEHKMFHVTAEKVVKWHNSPSLSARYDAQAQIDFEEVQRKSKEIVYLLTMLEFKMLTKQQKDITFQDIMKNPIGSISQILKRKNKSATISQLSLDMLKQDIAKTLR